MTSSSTSASGRSTRSVTAETLADTDVLPVAPVRLPVLSATELPIHGLGPLTDQECHMTVPLRLARGLREQIDMEAAPPAAEDVP
jgi:hypothetical protein